MKKKKEISVKEKEVSSKKEDTDVKKEKVVVKKEKQPKKEVKSKKSDAASGKQDSVKVNASDIALKSLSKKFGKDVLGWMDAMPECNKEVIPTGSLRLDNVLGIGGILRGRLYEIYGAAMSGKSTLCLSIIREAIKLGHKVIYIDAEHALDTGPTGLLAKMGIDTTKIALVKGYTAEDNLDIASSLIATGDFSFCVLDSISSLLPSAVNNLDSFGDQTMMVHPKLMSRMCLEFTPLCSRTNTALLMINQIRVSPMSYGASEVTPGGKAIGHHSSVRIRVSGGGVKSRLLQNSKGHAIGQRVTFEITKNKMSAPFRKTEAELIFGKGFSREGDVFDLAVEMGYIDKAGSWFSFNDIKLGQGKEKSMQYLEENKEVGKKIEELVLDMLKQD